MQKGLKQMNKPPEYDLMLMLVMLIKTVKFKMWFLRIKIDNFFTAAMQSLQAMLITKITVLQETDQQH